MPFLILASFLTTFVSARVIVRGIYAGWWKLGGFLIVHDRHIHHFNYGILLLALAGLFSLTAPRRRWWIAVIYGVGLGLVVDEFGMLLKLEDNYYSRLSYDAVIVVGTFFAMLATFSEFRDRMHKARRAHPAPLTAGTVLFREGEPGHEAFYLLAGRVRVVRHTPGGTQTLAEIGPGEFVGELALFTDRPRSATAEVIEDVQARRLDKKNLLFTIERHPELGARLLRSLAERLISANERGAESTTSQ